MNPAQSYVAADKAIKAGQEVATRHMRWEPIAGYGLRRTVSSDSLPHNIYLSSYNWGAWELAVDPDDGPVLVFGLDQLQEIVQKLKQLNEKDTHNGRDTYRERAEEQIPRF